jgi:hypothetical protein
LNWVLNSGLVANVIRKGGSASPGELRPQASSWPVLTIWTPHCKRQEDSWGCGLCEPSHRSLLPSFPIKSVLGRGCPPSVPTLCARLTHVTKAQRLGPDLAHVLAPGRGERHGMEAEDSLPSRRVVLCPDTHILVQVVGAQDGGVSGEVLEVVHDNSHKQV